MTQEYLCQKFGQRNSYDSDVMPNHICISYFRCRHHDHTSTYIIIISITLTSGTVVEKRPSSNNSKLSSQHYLWNPQKTTLNGLLQTNHHKMQYNVHSLSISCNRKSLLDKILPKISTHFNRWPMYYDYGGLLSNFES